VSCQLRSGRVRVVLDVFHISSLTGLKRSCRYNSLIVEANDLSKPLTEEMNICLDGVLQASQALHADSARAPNGNQEERIN
jgi:hypothetical protein